jgi:hypothetical protein
MSDIKCSICCDKGTEKLIQNKYCPCKYKVHNTCWKQYIKHCNKNNKDVTCLTCRITLKLKSTNIKRVIPSMYPYSPYSTNDFNYQEFQDSVIIVPTTPSTPTPTPTPIAPRNTDRIMFSDLTPQEKKERLIRAGIVSIVMLIMLIIIIVVFN